MFCESFDLSTIKCHHLFYLIFSTVSIHTLSSLQYSFSGQMVTNRLCVLSVNGYRTLANFYFLQKVVLRQVSRLRPALVLSTTTLSHSSRHFRFCNNKGLLAHSFSLLSAVQPLGASPTQKSQCTIQSVLFSPSSPWVA